MKKLPFIFCIAVCASASAQKKDLPDSLHQLTLAARYHSGFIFAHNIHVKNTKGLHPNGFEFEIARIKTDSATHAKFKCYPRLGLSFTYVDFDSILLGKSYSASYFIEPNYRLSNNLKMNFRASAGFSYLTQPHDSIKNPTNQSYSGHINSFLQLGLGLSYDVSKHISVYAMGNFFHNSNGGFKLPNAGVNYINASVGIQYFQYSAHLPSYKKTKDTSWKHKPLHFDVSVYYSPKGGYTGPDTAAKRKFVLGTSVQIVKQVSNLNALTAGAEIYYDDALRSIKDVIIKDNSSATLAGVLIGHQFLLNRFTFSQQLGFYVFKQTETFNKHYTDLFHTIYHRWGLNYKINDHWFAGIMLLAHNQIADFVDARITYRIK